MFILCERRNRTLYEIASFQTYRDAENYARRIGIWDFRIFDEAQLQPDNLPYPDEDPQPYPEPYPENPEPDNYQERERHGFNRVYQKSRELHQRVGLFDPRNPLRKKPWER